MMSRTVLGCLGGCANVHGEEAVGRRVPRERTHVKRAAIRMHERREETWRPLNRRRVAAFLEMYFLAMVYRENGHRYGYQSRASTKMLNKALVHRIIPWINRNRVWSRDESQWPISLVHVQELNNHLAANLPNIHAGRHWHNIIYYFQEIKKEQERWRRLDEMERERPWSRCDVA